MFLSVTASFFVCFICMPVNFQDISVNCISVNCMPVNFISATFHSARFIYEILLFSVNLALTAENT